MWIEDGAQGLECLRGMVHDDVIRSFTRHKSTTPLGYGVRPCCEGHSLVWDTSIWEITL